MRHLPVILVAAAVLASATASAQMLRNTPLGIKDVGIDDRSGSSMPLNAEFTNSAGQQVRLSRFFDGQRPVILTFNYASCPLLCKLQLNGLVESLRQLQWTVSGDIGRIDIQRYRIRQPAFVLLLQSFDAGCDQ